MESNAWVSKSIILVARQLGTHIGPNDIPDRFKIDDRELSPKEMCELARCLNLKLNLQKLA